MNFEQVYEIYGLNEIFCLCVFHILQQVWRWLYEKAHGISKNDRIIIMKLFNKLVYANGFESYGKSYHDLINSSSTQKYKNCLKYFEELCELSSSWALCFRKDQLLRGSNTNNYVEAQFLGANCQRYYS